MKKILLFVILTMCAGIGIAQPSLSSRISTLGTLNRTYYLYDTGFRRQNVMKHFRINDSLIHYDSIIAATVVSGHDLDATLTLGNESDLLVNIRNSGLEFKTYHTYNGLTTLHDPASSITDYPVTFIGREGSYNVLYLRDAFGYFGYMGAGTLTANRKVLLPDEGDGVGLDATLVTHTTEDPITVYDGAETGYYDADTMKLSDASGNEAFVLPYWVAVWNTTGTEKDVMVMDNNSLSYGYTNSVGSISHTATLFFNRPSFSGTTTDSLWFPSATNDTLAVKGDITAMGNFATTDLTLTGDRTHNFTGYSMTWDSVQHFRINDSLGNAIISNPASGINMVEIRHLTGLGSAPSIVAGTGAGTSPTVSVGSGSTDLSGYVNITTGTTCATDATVVTLTFSTAYQSAPRCIIITPANKITQNLTKGKECFVDQASITSTTFTITSNTTALTDATAYQWYYTVIQ